MAPRTLNGYQREIAALKERRSELVQDGKGHRDEIVELEAQIRALRAVQVHAYPELLVPVED